MKYWSSDATKLTNLLEALDDNVLTFHSTLNENLCNKHRLVHSKFNARLGPKEPAHTAQNQLVVLQQTVDEDLEEFVECTQQIALDV